MCLPFVEVVVKYEQHTTQMYPDSASRCDIPTDKSRHLGQVRGGCRPTNAQAVSARQVRAKHTSNTVTSSSLHLPWHTMNSLNDDEIDKVIEKLLTMKCVPAIASLSRSCKQFRYVMQRHKSSEIVTSYRKYWRRYGFYAHYCKGAWKVPQFYCPKCNKNELWVRKQEGSKVKTACRACFHRFKYTPSTESHLSLTRAIQPDNTTLPDFRRS